MLVCCLSGLALSSTTVGLGFGILSGLLVGLGFELLSKPFGVLVGGLLVGLLGGLVAFLRHFTLRFWLWATGSLPWNLVTFLDESAERLLLYKVGGGYAFVHRLLLDYFAALEKKDS